MISIKVEVLTDSFIKEVTPTLEIHREELQSFKDMQLNPHWDNYKLLQEVGKLVWIVAREDGIIVGYSLFIVDFNMHYKDFLFAIEDIFYVVPGKRGSRIAVKLVKASEEILGGLKVDVITHHAKFTNRFAPFLEKLGYSKTETMLAKRLMPCT